jgi:prepilin-type N-terminal cleavage/methylation domain-containing protein
MVHREEQGMMRTSANKQNRNRPCRPASAQAGFTLLELLLVLSLIAISVGIVMPRIGNTDNSTFNAQVRRAVASLTYARRMAVVQSTPQVAAFYALDPDSPDYAEWLEELEGDTEHWLSELLTLQYQADLNEAPESVEKVEITFFPQGGSTGGILNFALNGRTANIRVDPITGKITTAWNGEDPGESF